jgi:hypothetical protein
MKRTFILLFFCCSLTNYSQNLTLDELVSLRKSDIANVEEYLSQKGWTFLSSEEGDNESLSGVAFAYKKEEYSDDAESFFHYYRSDSTDVRRINLQIFNTSKYNSYLARIKSLGCKLIDSGVFDGEIKKIYQGATTTFMITIKNRKDEVSDTTETIYHIAIIDNLDYFLSFSESE